ATAFLTIPPKKHSDTPNQVAAISGSNVTLKISGLSDNSKRFTWLYNSIQKIVEWESNNIKYFKSDFKDRVRLGESHELCIYNTRKEDSGTYILREVESGVEVAHSISLKVLAGGQLWAGQFSGTFSPLAPQRHWFCWAFTRGQDEKEQRVSGEVAPAKGGAGAGITFDPVWWQDYGGNDDVASSVPGTLAPAEDPVPKPKLNIETRKKPNNSCHLKLSCEIPDRSVNQSVSYTWYGDSQPFPTDVNRDVLEITVNPQNFSGSYTCQVSNAVSKKNRTVYFTSPCTLARSSEVVRTTVWLLVMVPVVPCLLWT
uniref:Ig-like domain-containing protein n=1 Tax=Suricata suricatta TaxID=37032 RepID=A0A673T5H4_SURSU